MVSKINTNITWLAKLTQTQSHCYVEGANGK